MFCPQYGQLLNLGASPAGAAWAGAGCAGAGWGCACGAYCICIWGDGLPQLLQNLYGYGFGLPQ